MGQPETGKQFIRTDAAAAKFAALRDELRATISLVMTFAKAMPETGQRCLEGCGKHSWTIRRSSEQARQR